MFSAQDSTEIRRPAANVFALLDDFEQAPQWMESCVALVPTPREARSPGTRVDYRYNMAGQEGAMTGTITAHVPDQELAIDMSDALFDLKVTFRLEPTEFGTRLFHSIGIEPKFNMARYMETMVQAGNRKQVGSNLAKVKRLVESTNEPPVVP